MDVAGGIKPMTPVRAIFDQVLPAQRQDVPLWMDKVQDASPSEPPASAAALLYSSEDLESQVQNNARCATETAQYWPFSAPLHHQGQTFDRELEELHAAIASLKQTESELLEQLTPHLARLMRLIAARVLVTEALSDPELPLRLVREGLSQLNHDGQVAVILGSAFEATVQLLQTRLKQEGIHCTVQVLAQVSPFTCYVSAQFGFVDASLEARLELALQNFLPRADGS